MSKWFYPLKTDILTLIYRVNAASPTPPHTNVCEGVLAAEQNRWSYVDQHLQ